MARDWKTFERNTAKALGNWWGCEFRRTPSSGAWGKQTVSLHSMKASDEFFGDIVAPKEAGFPFSVECKAHKEVELYKALYGKSNVYSWWKQCLGDTHDGKHPMLVMKANNKKPLVAISYSTWIAIKHKCSIIRRVTRLALTGWGDDGALIQIMIMDLTEFLNIVSAKSVKEALS
jgi:hypothetical protein